MTQGSAPSEPSSSRSPRRPPRLSVASLVLPILGALVCAVSVPGSERRGGEMFSTGLLVCLSCVVGGAIVGLLLAVVAVVRRESPAALWAAGLILNAAIMIYAYS